MINHNLILVLKHIEQKFNIEFPEDTQNVILKMSDLLYFCEAFGLKTLCPQAGSTIEYKGTMDNLVVVLGTKLPDGQLITWLSDLQGADKLVCGITGNTYNQHELSPCNFAFISNKDFEVIITNGGENN